MQEGSFAAPNHFAEGLVKISLHQHSQVREELDSKIVYAAPADHS